MGALLSSLVSWFMRGAVLKLFIFTALFVVVSSFIGYLSSKLPGPAELNSALSAFTPGMWYFADLTMFTHFFPGIISAYILRFSIRRIPFIG